MAKHMIKGSAILYLLVNIKHRSLYYPLDSCLILTLHNAVSSVQITILMRRREREYITNGNWEEY